MYRCIDKPIYNYQLRFRKSHSTSHAIISLVEKINNALDSGQIVIGVFLDFYKKKLSIQIFTKLF